MPDSLDAYLDPPANPRQRVHSIASKIGVSLDIADDYLKVAQLESGHNVNVRDSSKGAQGFGQVMPDARGGSTRTIGGRRYNLRNPDENVEAGLRLFSAGGSDPIGRRLEYFGGPRARQHYERTGRIPNISDGNLTASQYVAATGARQQQKPVSDLDAYLDPQPSEQTPPTSKPSDLPRNPPVSAKPSATRSAPITPAPTITRVNGVETIDAGPSGSVEIDPNTMQPVRRRAKRQLAQPVVTGSSGLGELRRLDEPEVARIQRLQAEEYKRAQGAPTLDYMGTLRGRERNIRAAQIAADRASQERQAEEQAQRDAPELERLTRQYRQEIREAARITPNYGPTKWFQEALHKGEAGLMELGAAATKPFSAEKASRIRLHAEAMQRAAVEEGADRNVVSQTLQDTVGGLIGTAPELVAMSLGAPPIATFGAGGGLRAYGRGESQRNIAKATAHGAATGAAFELPVPSGLTGTVTRAAAKGLEVGGTTGAVELASGATPQQAAATGLTNALMSTHGELNREAAPVKAAVREEFPIGSRWALPVWGADEFAVVTENRNGTLTLKHPISGQTVDEPVKQFRQEVKKGLIIEKQAEAQPNVPAQPETVESTERTSSSIMGRESIGDVPRNRSLQTNADVAVGVPEDTPQRFYHRDYGEVTESPNQRRVGKGRVRIVAEDGTEHVIKRADMSGRGNQRAVPIKPAEAAPPASSNIEQYLEPERGDPTNTEAPKVSPPATTEEQAASPARGLTEQGNAEIRPQESSVTAVKNASMAEDRTARDLPELVQAEPRKAAEVHQRALEANAKDPRAVDRLVEQSLASDRNLTDVETAQVRLRAQEIKNRESSLLNEVAATNDPQAIREKRAELDSLTSEFDRLSQATKKSGTEWGRAGVARQQAIDQDFSLVAMKARLKAAKGESLSDAESAKVEDLHRRLQQAQTDLAAANETLAQRDLQKQIDRASRRRQRTETKQSLDDEFAQLRAQFAQARAETRGVQASGLAGLDPEGKLTKLIGQMARNRVRAGITDAAQLVDDIHAAIAEHLPDVTKRDVRDAISGYGLEPKGDKRGEAAKQLAEIRAELKQLSTSEDVATGKRLSRQDKQRQAQLTKQEAELQRRMAAGDFASRSRQPVVYARETNALQERVNRVKEEFEQEKHKAEQANRTPAEKALDLLVRWKRFAVLTYPTTLGKLATAATGRMAQSPAEEAIGGVLSYVPGISKIAERAPREGGINLKAEAKAVSQLWQSDTFKGMLEQLKTGRDMLDVLYGKKKGESGGVLELPGRSHGALKQVAKRAEFFRALEKRLEYAGRHGQDIRNPEVQMATAMEAYNDALRSIFMQPNMVSDAFNQLMGSLARRGTSGKVLAALGRIEFPITRVPVNYVAEQTSLIPPVGIAKGIVRVVMSKGIGNLKPAEADYVLRAWKKAGVGLGMMTLGYLRPNIFGGYYQQNDKRGDNEPKFGEVKVGSVRIPKWATHIPIIEAAQFGATIRRVEDKIRAKGGDHPLATGAADASWELTKEVPFVNQPERLLRAMESGDKLKAGSILAGQEARGMIPGAVQQVARSTDRATQGENRTRRSQGFTDEVKQGIPGLRQTVPISPFFGPRARPSSDEAQRLGVRLVGVQISPKETPEQFAERRRTAVPVMLDALDQLVTSDRYKNLSDDDKRKEIHTTVTRIAEQYKAQGRRGGRASRPSRMSRFTRQ